MGWLSLLTKAVPKLWRSGLKATSTLWQGGKAATVNVANATAKVASAAARNPKTAVVGGVAAFAGWQKLTHSDESYGTAVGKTLRKGVDGTGDFSHDVVNGFTGKNTVEDVKDTATNVLTDVKDTAVEAKGVLGTLGETLRGISHFLGNLFGGNGTNMFGNFLDNLVRQGVGPGHRSPHRRVLSHLRPHGTARQDWRCADGDDDGWQQRPKAGAVRCPDRG